MKLTLNKKALKQLSIDNAVLPSNMTPQIAGGAWTASCQCVLTTDLQGDPSYDATVCGCNPAPTLDVTCNPATE